MKIKKIDFDGMDAMEIVTSKARMVVVTSMGPRIAHFGTRQGRNLLFWDYPKKYRRGQWRLMGGHRIWATRPMADESEESYADDNGPCAVHVTARGLKVHGPVHPVFKIRKSLRIKVNGDDTFAVENSITNESEMVWSGGIWSLTCTLPRPKTTYGIPLGRAGEWDIFSMALPRRWAGGQFAKVNDKAFTLTEDCLILRPAGRISKRMVQAPQGLIGMTDPGEKISFVKLVPYLDEASYPWNCNMAFYVGKGNFMVEMENMGPIQGVLPGRSIFTTETWMLRKPINWQKLKGLCSVK